MRNVARWVEIGVGLFFVVSAVAKALDMDAFGVQISAYNVVKDAGLVRVSAWFALAAETVLGSALLLGMTARGVAHLASTAMILVYSALIAYAWQYHGLKDCGCLGAWIAMGPVESLLKNAALAAGLGFAWYQGRTTVPTEVAGSGGFRRRAAMAGLGIGILAVAVISSAQRRPEHMPTTLDLPRDDSKPFAQFVFEADGQRFDLGSGEHLVALLNATCEHCRASVPGLNRLIESPGLPPLVALMMGDEEELADFQTQTQPLFSAHLIPPLTFMEFIGTVPPRLSYIKDGVGVQHWDWEDAVPEAEILARLASPAK